MEVCGFLAAKAKEAEIEAEEAVHEAEAALQEDETPRRPLVLPKQVTTVAAIAPGFCRRAKAPQLFATIAALMKEKA